MPLDEVFVGDPHSAAHNEEREFINDLMAKVLLVDQAVADADLSVDQADAIRIATIAVRDSAVAAAASASGSASSASGSAGISFIAAEAAEASALLAADISEIDSTDDAIDVALRVPGSKSSATVIQRMGENAVVHAAFYGAKGDDLTDDAPALQAAITALSVLGGGTLSLNPRGIYRINAPLQMASNVILDGGALRSGTTPTGDLNARGRYVLFPSGVTGAALTRVRFLQPAVPLSLSSSEQALVQIIGNRNRVDDCTFLVTLGASSGAIFVKTGNHNVITNNYLENLGITYGYTGSSYTLCANNTIVNAVGNALGSVGNGGAGVANLGCQVINNIIINAGRFGIEDHGTSGICRGTLIHGNIIIGAVQMGMSAVGEASRITDNYIINSGSYAIETTAGGNVIMGNTCRWETPNGVTAIGINSTPPNGREGAICVGNTVENCGRAIYVLNGATRVVIANNNIRGWSVTGISTVALNTLIEGNTLEQVTETVGANFYGIQFSGRARVLNNVLTYKTTGVQTPLRWNSTSTDTLVAGNIVDGGGVTHTSGSGSGSAAVERVTLRDNVNVNSAGFNSQGMTGIVATNNYGFTITASLLVDSFFNGPRSSKPVVTGSRAGESAASTSLRAALVALNLITDNTTA